MFPGLELTNDDEGVNVRPAPVVQMFRDGRFRTRTFHLDVRFESAFVQLGEVAQAVRAALEDGRRLVCEHFDALYPALGTNAQFLLGVGDQIIVARPDVFGPYPEEVASAVEGTAKYRRMAHTAEDLTVQVLEDELDYERPEYHSDVPRGFVIEFDENPEGLDLNYVERRVKELIEADLPVSYAGENAIRIGGTVHRCHGPRIHVSRTSEIERFRIVKELTYDPFTETYDLVGLVGEPMSEGEPWPGGFLSRHPRDPEDGGPAAES
jgi:hypothetical protein